MSSKLTLDESRLYTTEETAELLAATPRQVVRLRHSKKLGCVRLTGAAVRHSGAQIKAFIDAATEAPSE